VALIRKEVKLKPTLISNNFWKLINLTIFTSSTVEWVTSCIVNVWMHFIPFTILTSHSLLQPWLCNVKFSHLINKYWSTVYAKKIAAKIFGGQALKVSFCRESYSRRTGSQNKPMKTWQILTKPRYRQRKNRRACILYTHMQHDSCRQTISMQRTCGQNHLKAAITEQNSSLIIVHSIWENIILYVIELTE
jgi:hypothetical protein